MFEYSGLDPLKMPLDTGRFEPGSYRPNWVGCFDVIFNSPGVTPIGQDGVGWIKVGMWWVFTLQGRVLLK